MDVKEKFVLVSNTFYEVCRKICLNDAKNGLVRLCEEKTNPEWKDGRVLLFIDCSEIEFHQYEDIKKFFFKETNGVSRISRIKNDEKMQGIGILWDLKLIPANNYLGE